MCKRFETEVLIKNEQTHKSWKQPKCHIRFLLC